MLNERKRLWYALRLQSGLCRWVVYQIISPPTPPSDDDVQEPRHLCHDPNVLCLPPLHPLLAHQCPPLPAASQLQTHNPWTWIIQSPRTHLGPVTTVTSWGTLPGTPEPHVH